MFFFYTLDNNFMLVTPVEMDASKLIESGLLC